MAENPFSTGDSKGEGMHTGIVPGTFEAVEVQRKADFMSFAVRFPPQLLEDLGPGASVNVDGVCQTVVTDHHLNRSRRKDLPYCTAAFWSLAKRSSSCDAITFSPRERLIPPPKPATWSVEVRFV
jgi:hypothetical protein